MKIPVFHINPFSDDPFGGNPAAVCLLDEWFDESKLSLIAQEDNLPVTAFVKRGAQSYELRWFTPKIELDICGHGTLAASATLFTECTSDDRTIKFETRAGILEVYKDRELYCMKLPLAQAKPCTSDSDQITRALGKEAKEVLRCKNYLVIFESEEEIIEPDPDMDMIRRIDCVGIIVSAKSNNYDFVSRYFAPSIGIKEDAATGSAQSTLFPYWASRLGKDKLKSAQLSERGGEFVTEAYPEGIVAHAKATRFSEGHIYV